MAKKKEEEPKWAKEEGFSPSLLAGNPLEWLAHEYSPSDLKANLSGKENKLFGHLEDNTPAPKKKEAKQPKLPSPEKATKDTEQSPYEQLANTLAQQYLTQINQLQPLISGQSATGLEGEAGQGSQQQLQQLLAGAGVSPALAKATEAPIGGTDPLQGNVNSAMQAQAAAQIPAAEGYAGAVKETGQANTQTLTAAPWEQILQELASETAYRAASGTGAAAFGGTTANTPSFLQQYFSQLGLGSVPSPGAKSTLPSTPGAVTNAAKGGAATNVPSDGNATTP